MKRFLFLPILSFVLTSCATTEPLLTERTTYYSGGQRVHDTVSYFWYTEKNSQGSSAADYVLAGDSGWYKTSYRWTQGIVKEVMREGEKMEDGELVPFSTHIRFNDNGEAVFQVYRRDGKVLPLDAEVLQSYLQHGHDIAAVTKAENRKGLSLIQGFWNGQRFVTCDGKEYSTVEFDQTLPNFVVHRLSGMNNYLSLVGKASRSRVQVNQLLVLDDDNHECVSEPSLFKD